MRMLGDANVWVMQMQKRRLTGQEYSYLYLEHIFPIFLSVGCGENLLSHDIVYNVLVCRPLLIFQ